MATRKRVALIYAYNENWIGGTYYIENLIAALATLRDSEQPELLIFCREPADADRLRQAVQYAHWSFRQFERRLSLPERIINKAAHLLTGKRPISSLYHDAELIFPLPTGWRHYFSRIPHHLYWIPDFQEHYLPAFFQAEEIQARKADQRLVLELARHIVFSSRAAQHDFNAIYPGSNLTQHILPFAVSHRADAPAATECLARYQLTGPYFICSNQFWKHKNHPVVLQAVAKLRDTHPQVQVVFTGKEHDYRNPSYFAELMVLRESLGVEAQTRFLGFIPRDDQQVLMASALAVIQPSLFEGWSTVVEDAKSMQVPLLVSDLAVHREQLQTYAAAGFFNPAQPEELAEAMHCALAGKLPAKPYTYRQDVARFGQEFMRIVHQITA
ncbi:glycosyltransferase family 4 protein [Hymenobacter metallilatus]|uniref:Glycosyltransferase n=1 Tax=Hymenobacter metallilatus TaxID=2493666 RepID=A0A428JQW8_9BACT|nr:glycosyltransferase family 1 protein [Hymenobacter metallilatus]RSK36042.1 glycosyltransferase [Hymenobacter metallilatus]